MYSGYTVKFPAEFRAGRQMARPLARTRAAGRLRIAGLALAMFGFFAVAAHMARAGEPARIHWMSVEQAQVKIDQTTPLTWGVYQPGKKDKPDKKLSHLVLALVGHRYLLIDLKAKQVYEVPLKQVHEQDGGIDTDDAVKLSRRIPTSNWNWRNVGPAELYRITLGDYGRMLQLTLPHLYLISPYY
jgi:hypothetical protein